MFIDRRCLASSLVAALMLCSAPFCPAQDAEGKDPTPAASKKSKPAAAAESEQIELTAPAGNAESCARLLTALFELHGDKTPLIFKGDAREGTITITGPKRTLKKLREVLADHEGVEAESLVVRVFHLQHASADQLIRTVDGLHKTSRSPWVAVFDPSVNAITVKGVAQDVEEAADVIALLDQPRVEQPARPVTEIVRLAHADARSLCGLMNNAAGPAECNVEVFGDERTNSLLLIGPPDDVAKARELVNLLDADVPVPTASTNTTPTTSEADSLVAAHSTVVTEAEEKAAIQKAKKKFKKPNEKAPEDNTTSESEAAGMTP